MDERRQSLGPSDSRSDPTPKRALDDDPPQGLAQRYWY
jgi:hypothetical protein